MSKAKYLLIAAALAVGVLYSQTSNVLSYYTTLQVVTGRQEIKIPTQLYLGVSRDVYGNVTDVKLYQHQVYATVGVGSDTVQLTNGAVTSITQDTNAQGLVVP